MGTSPRPSLRVLLVENNGGQVERTLRGIGYDVTTVRSIGGLKSCLQSRGARGNYDIVVINFGVEHGIQIETYREAKSSRPSVPVLAVAEIDEFEEVTSVIHFGELESISDKIEDTLERHVYRTLQLALSETDDFLKQEQTFLESMSRHGRKNS